MALNILSLPYTFPDGSNFVPINALNYGAPPHGGIAPGLDRIVMLLANEKNIREVTLFPMNQNAQDLMMNAPSEINENQLKELNLTVKIKK